jgi:hypothetical protein
MSDNRNMNDQMPDDSDAPEATLQRLRDLRRGLLRLHKTLLDTERAAYEQLEGRVSSGELLQLVISHEQFAWLHAISELIVKIDETMDADEPATIGDAKSLFMQVQALLSPAETGSEFERKYFAALQREPDAVLAHREVKRILSAGS